MAAFQLQPGEAVYLYCFTAAGAPVPAAAGVDAGRPPGVHACGALAAVVSAVAVAEFTGEAGAEHLQDLAWLGPRACRHGAVIEAAMAGGPVFPLPFGTLFSSLAALDAEIEARRGEIAALLQQAEGCQEWALEATLDRAKAVDCRFFEELRTGRFELPQSAGRRHLEEQKARRTLAAELDDWLDPVLLELHRTLSALSRDSRPRKLLETRVLNQAYLVTLDAAEPFAATVAGFVERYQDYGLELRLTGPWPPYSFCQAPPAP